MKNEAILEESSTARAEHGRVGPFRVLVSGASGMVGRALGERLATLGHGVTPLLRPSAAGRGNGGAGVAWDPAQGELDGAAMADLGAQAVVHLAGENIAEGRWTDAKMDAIRSSRVQGTRLLAESLARLEDPPRVLVSASAIGFYGDRGEEWLGEDAGPGQGFLPEVCQAWEQATEPARAAGIRVVNLRIGVVLSRDGGALAKMLTPFKLGLGGRIGSGRQYMSWILLDDLVSAITHAITEESLEGPVNATAPQPVTNEEFTKTLGRVLKRPTLLPMPAPAARLAFGRMAEPLLLEGARVAPRALQGSGFQFDAPDLETALRRLLT